MKIRCSCEINLVLFITNEKCTYTTPMLPEIQNRIFFHLQAPIFYLHPHFAFFDLLFILLVYFTPTLSQRIVFIRFQIHSFMICSLVPCHIHNPRTTTQNIYAVIISNSQNIHAYKFLI